MSKPKLLKLEENYISHHLSLYHSFTMVDDLVSRHNFMSREPEVLSQPYKHESVGIFVFNKDKSKMLLIKEFRYPINNYVISTPAGLIDSGESITDAAIRELYEEVGYTKEQVTIEYVLQPSYSSVGLSDEQTASVFVTVDDSIKPKQHLEASEDITYFWIDAHQAKYFLENGYFSDDLMRYLDLEPKEKIGVTARTQFTLKHFTETLPSKEFRSLIDSI